MSAQNFNFASKLPQSEDFQPKILYFFEKNLPTRRKLLWHAKIYFPFLVRVCRDATDRYDMNRFFCEFGNYSFI